MVDNEAIVNRLIKRRDVLLATAHKLTQKTEFPKTVEAAEMLTIIANEFDCVLEGKNFHWNLLALLAKVKESKVPT